MNDFNFSAYDRWCDKKEWEAEGHDSECNCELCHEWHMEEKKRFLDNALESLDFKCCRDEFEFMIENGELCAKHPRAYFEPARYHFPAWCEECEPMKEVK